MAIKSIVLGDTEFWEDSSHNCWTKEFYSKKEAEVLSKTMFNSSYNFDCSNLDNCVKCLACHFCYNCVDCICSYDCSDCENTNDSYNCERLEDCDFCHDSKDSKKCNRCYKVENCENCTNCSVLEDCQECNNCFNSRGLNDAEQVCFHFEEKEEEKSQ